jgi:hypothetical protein
VALRPRGPFEPDPGAGSGAWPDGGVTELHDEADHGSGRHAASWPPLSPTEPGLVDFGPVNPGETGPGRGDLGGTDAGRADPLPAGPGAAGPGRGGLGQAGAGLGGSRLDSSGRAGPGLVGTGPAGHGRPGASLDGSGPAGAGLAGAGPAEAERGDAGDLAPVGRRADARPRLAGRAGGGSPDGASRPGAWTDRPRTPDRRAPDEELSGTWTWADGPAGSRSRRVPEPVRGTGAGRAARPVDGADLVKLRPEDGASATAQDSAGLDGAVRAVPTVASKDLSGSGAPPSLDELMARHVIPALRAAGAIRSGRDSVRLAEEPVTERRGGDVHVHLGRIEVVAPPATAPRARPRPAAPDHEAYLARRRQDRR